MIFMIKVQTLRQQINQKRRLVPIEDFAIGIPPIVKTYTNNTLPSFNKM